MSKDRRPGWSVITPYTVLEGETLESIALKLYGDEELAALLHYMSQIYIDEAAARDGRPPGTVVPGMVISLPTIELLIDWREVEV